MIPTVYKKENKIIVEFDEKEFEKIFDQRIISENLKENGDWESDMIEIFLSEDEEGYSIANGQAVTGLAFWRKNGTT
jgi:hypothetical protein